ncbi:hypothetical protein OG948_34140 (plasmid) [Embleya sp. NBC_00888]|uniref:hypothetical protein n=1 Tax=Embleya sp. NBC_00888 TaxID=2975960 RepID=UPI002F9104ED|nr:hypothetical protein OG948_34140 [Embleya sp. NBC_00888]
MSTEAIGAELRFELPDVAPGTVIGTVEVIADRPDRRTIALVASGVPVRVRMPATLGYTVRGRLTRGERLSGYAAVDGREPWVPLKLHTSSDSRCVAVAATRFPDAPWAAEWTWDMLARRFVSSRWLTPLGHAAGTILTSGVLKSTNLAQVSPSGGPARFVLRPAETPLWVVGDHVEPEPGLALTLLGCMHRADMSAAGAVAAEALRIRDSIESSSRILLDLALGYYLLDAEDDRLANWAAQLTDGYDWSADAHLIAAHMLLRRRGDHGHEIAECLETALACGLPVITRGLQLLSDSLDLTPGPEAAVRRAVLPYAICARPDSVLTTFWGESPDSPRGAPILGTQPPHAVPLAAGSRLVERLGAGDRPVERLGPIASPIEALLQPAPQPRPASARLVIANLHRSLEKSLRLASHLSLARTAPEVARLIPLLREALQHAERPATVLASGLARPGTAGRRAGSVSRKEHDQKAFEQVRTALADAGHELRVHAGAVSRAGSLEYAQAQAIANAATAAARLAADVRNAATALRDAGIETDAAVGPASVERTTVHAVET